jgi:cytochrome c1
LAGDAALVDAGKALIAQKGCGACHTIPGIPGASGNIGPNLAGVASRTRIAGGAVPNNGPDDLKRWIMNPPAIKPGTAMPNLGLTDDEATKIVAYLETLK